MKKVFDFEKGEKQLTDTQNHKHQLQQTDAHDMKVSFSQQNQAKSKNIK